MYNLEELKKIPIKDICSIYGIELTKKGQNFWGKIRTEKTSSFSINPSKNIWRDWGVSKGGDVISLVAELENVEYGKAISILGEKFNINKKSLSKNFLPTKREFKQIGINSEKVFFNFIINVEKQSIDKLEFWEKKYSISMYQLSKKNKEMYHKILDSRALPIICEERKKFFYLLKKLEKEESDLEKKLYKNKMLTLAIDINMKIDIYNKARLDKNKKNYLKIKLED